MPNGAKFLLINNSLQVQPRKFFGTQYNRDITFGADLREFIHSIIPALISVPPVLTNLTSVN